MPAYNLCFAMWILNIALKVDGNTLLQQYVVRVQVRESGIFLYINIYFQARFYRKSNQVENKLTILIDWYEIGHINHTKPRESVCRAAEAADTDFLNILCLF